MSRFLGAALLLFLAAAAFDWTLDMPGSVGELVGGARVHDRAVLYRAGHLDGTLAGRVDVAQGAEPERVNPFYLTPVYYRQEVARELGNGMGYDLEALPGGRTDGTIAARSDGQGTTRELSDRSGNRLTVRLTYFTSAQFDPNNAVWGTMNTGFRIVPNAVAVDPAVIPFGTILRVVGDGKLWVALDRGPAVNGKHVDFYFEDDAEGRAFIARWGEWAEIEVLQ